MPASLLESQLQQLSYSEEEMHLVFSSSEQSAEQIVDSIMAHRAAVKAAA
jgi:gluconate kinase